MASMFGTSGKNGRNAAIWTAGIANETRDKVNSLYDEGLGNSLEALGQARSGFATAQDSALGAIDNGYQTARNDLSGVSGFYQPWHETGQGAHNMLANSFGLNGPEGNFAATQAFQAGPAYEFQRKQAEDSAMRNASRLGIAGSGNTLTALSTLGGNLANQEYGNWQRGLMGMSQQGLSAAGGMGQAQQSLASLASNTGQTRADLYGRFAGQQGALYGAEAGLYSADAQNRVNNENRRADIVTQAGQAGFKAGDQAAQNRGNLVMQGAKLGTSLLGSFMGGGF